MKTTMGHFVAMGFLSLGFALTLGAPPAEAKPKKKETAKAQSKADSYTEALTLLSRNCAGCHNSADHPGALFLNQARLSEKETLDLMIQLVEKSEMPPAHKEFRDSADGKKILAFLKAERKALK